MTEFIKHLEKEKDFLSNLHYDDRIAHINMYAEYYLNNE